MIEKHPLQAEHLDFSSTQYTRKCPICRDCARLLHEKSIGLLLGFDLLFFTVNRQKSLTSQTICYIMKASKGVKGGRRMK